LRQIAGTTFGVGYYMMVSTTNAQGKVCSCTLETIV